MSKTVNVAMIGLGFGGEFIPIYQAHPNTNVIAICRRNEVELNKAGDQFGIERRYNNYDDVLADPDVDFVHINSPISDHAWMSLKALDAGKHVMCTVPMATTIDECRQIVEKVKQTGLKYMMAETVVYSREFLFIKDMYDKGELGKIQHLAASHPQDMDGWPEYWQTNDPDALRDSRRQPVPGIDQRTCGVRELLWLGNGSRRHRRRSRAIRLPSNRVTSKSRTATSRRTSGGSCTTLPDSTARASMCMERRRALSGR